MPAPVIQQNEPETQTVTIAASGSLTSAVHLPNGQELVAIIMPAAWTAAAITFQASVDNSAFANVYTSAGTEVSLTVAAAHFVPIAPGTLNGARYLKLRSGTGASAVAQAAERTLTLVTRPTA